jgi:hypothetical protein
MSRSLDLLVVGSLNPKKGFSGGHYSATLSLDFSWDCQEYEDESLYDNLRNVPSKDLPPDAYINRIDEDEGGVTEDHNDHLGQPLRYATAGDLALPYWPFCGIVSKAIQAFLMNLPSDWPIVLDWG